MYFIMFQDDDINRIQNYEAHPLQEVEYDIDKGHVYQNFQNETIDGFVRLLLDFPHLGH